jgi:ribosome-associated protein
MQTITAPLTTPVLYNSEELALLAARAADDRKAGDMILLKVGEVSFIADYLLIVTGFSRAQLRAISESIQAQIEETYNIQPISIEGESQGNWVLVDYGDVIIHVMSPDGREFYNLEAFWSHGELIEIPTFEE